MAWSVIRSVSEPPRWHPILLGTLGAAVAVAGLAAAWLIAVHLWRSTCDHAYARSDWPYAKRACLASYDASRNEDYLLLAAKSYMRANDFDDAQPLFERLLRGLRYGDAHLSLSYIALHAHEPELGELHVAIASVAALLSSDQKALSDTWLMQSNIALSQGRYTEAVAAARMCAQLARRAGDRQNLISSLIAEMDAYRRMGAIHDALGVIGRLDEIKADDCRTAEIKVKEAMVWMGDSDSNRSHEVRAALDDAEQAGRDCPSLSWGIRSQILFNGAFSWTHDAPDRAAQLLHEIENSGNKGGDFELQLGHACIAAERGDLASAARFLRQTESLVKPDEDWPWELARERGNLIELRGGPLGRILARYHYGCAIALVSKLRATSPEDAGYVIAGHRGPYDDLIASLARAGLWREVLGVVLELDASDMLRAVGDHRSDSRLVLDAGTPARVAALPAIDDVVAAWRGRDLVIVIAPSPRNLGPDPDRAYRVRVVDGRVTGEDVGRASELRKAATQAVAKNIAAARQLSAAIVPPDLDGHAHDALYVLAIGPLSKIVLPALREPDGSLTTARRPLVRMPGLRALRPASQGTGKAVVLADSNDDLAFAKTEGDMVATRTGGTLYRARAATTARLDEAAGASLLHIAGHVVIKDRWHVIKLADGDVSPVELVGRHIAPRLAVLASCGSSAGGDEEGWSSVAAAFLESGTSFVVATDRPIDDRAGATLMTWFYGQPDWSTDMPRALAQVQQRAAAEGLAGWDAFSISARPPMVPARD